MTRSPPMPLGGRPLGLAALLLAAACDDPDPLDPDRLADIAVDEGDARGDAFSGTYGPVDPEIPVLEIESCDCPQIGAADGCLLVAELESSTDSLNVLQRDGFVRLTYRDVQLSGPLDADGSVVAASVRDESNFLYTAYALARLDGRFERDSVSTQLDATMQQRLQGDLLDESIDCRVRFRVRATR